MKKRINKHIENKDFVKVYITDNDDTEITHFEGLIFEQNDKLILMNDMTDFYYDGLVILKKKDISEIKCSDNEKFFKQILEKEKLTAEIYRKREALKISLAPFRELFSQIQNLCIPVIIECKYGNDDRFQIGPIYKVSDKKVRIKYFNARGEYDVKPVSSKFKEITSVKIDSPYANMFYKYAKEIE